MKFWKISAKSFCFLSLSLLLIAPLGAQTQYEPREEEGRNLIKEVPENLIQSVPKGIEVAPKAAEDALKAEQSEPNPLIGIPKGVYEFLLSGFEGAGVWFDQLGTGDKAIQGSFKGKSDPLPVREHERKF